MFDTTTCDPEVIMEHESGCDLYSFSGFIKFMDENPWLPGTILVVFGAILCLFGRRFFPIIMGIFGIMVGFCTIMYFSSIFGWLSKTWSLIVLIIVAVLVGLLLGFVLFKMTAVSIAVLGVFAGIFAGFALYSFILACSGYDALWMLITFAAIGGIIFGYFSFRFNKGFLSLCTALLGGYMFMRGWTFYFGGFPSEAEQFSMLVHGEDLDLGW